MALPWCSVIRPERLAAFRQYAATFCACMSSFTSGCAFVWLTPLMPRLLGPDSEVPMTEEQLSWVVSIIEIGDVFTPIPAALLADKCGRKPVLLASGPCHLAAWIIILTTRSVLALCIARFFQGMAMGIMFSVLPVYLAEIASPELRGRTGIFVQYSWHLGLIFEYSLGPFLTYSQVAWVSMPPTVVFVLLFMKVPESPHYLLAKGLDGEAARSLSWYRGGGDTSREMSELAKELKDRDVDHSGWSQLLCTRKGLVAMGLVFAVINTYLMGGLPAMMSYASVVFSPGGRTVSTIIFGLLLIVTFPVFGRLMDAWGRRPVFLCSSAVASVCALMVGLQRLFHPPYVPPWVPDIFIVVQLVFLAGGVDAAAPILQSELFPGSTRALASSLLILVSTVLSFASFESYYLLNVYVGVYSNFIVFSAFSTLGFFVILIFLPETKGKTFDEIQNSL